MDLKCNLSCSSGEATQSNPSDRIYFQISEEPSLNNPPASGNKSNLTPGTSQPNSYERPVSASSKVVEENEFTLKELPNEVLVKIFSFLSSREILEVSRVCWKFNLLSKDVSLWRQTEAEISSNEELHNFCRYFRLCYLLNTREKENTTVRYPYEALTQIFSHLSKAEILNTSIAIWKFNNQSKNSSLWQMIKLIIMYEEKLKNIFSVIDQTTPIKCLSLLFRHREPSYFSSPKRSILSVEPSTWRLETSELNDFFKQAKQLYCLNLQSLELASVILPPTVKHISISLNCGPNGNENSSAHCCLDAVSQLSLLRHCPNNIEHLGLYAHRRYVELNKSIKDLLMKFQLSLTSLHIDTLHTSKDLIPLITNCYKLKELGLYLYDNYDPENEFSFLDISQMPNLESFTMKVECFQSYSSYIFQEKGFSKLVYFHINCQQSHLRKTDFKVLLSNMPYLETFLYNAHIPNRNGDIRTEEEHWENVVIEFCEFVKNCSTLNRIGFDLSSFHNKPKAFLVKKIIQLQKQRHFESVCLCKLIFKGPKERLFRARELCEMVEGFCKTCMYSVDESYKCSCWKRGGSFNRGYKRHLHYDRINLNTLELYDQLIDRELAANEGRIHSESHCYFALR